MIPKNNIERHWDIGCCANIPISFNTPISKNYRQLTLNHYQIGIKIGNFAVNFQAKMP